MERIFINLICLYDCLIGCVSTPGTRKICWEIKLWAVFSFASVIKPSDTSCHTSEANQVCLTSFQLLIYLLHSPAVYTPPPPLKKRGNDRCRHFVITQNQDGQFVISGDCQTYGSLTELIEHYKVSPIQPFGEYLTSSCYEVRRQEVPLTHKHMYPEDYLFIVKVKL